MHDGCGACLGECVYQVYFFVEAPSTSLYVLMFDYCAYCDTVAPAAGGTAGKQQTPCVCVCVCVCLDFYAPPVEI